MFNEDLDRRTVLKLIGLSGLLLPTIVNAGVHDNQGLTFERKWQEKYNICSKDYLESNFLSISEVKDYIHSEQSKHLQDQVLGLYLTKTEFALLAYLGY